MKNSEKDPNHQSFIEVKNLERWNWVTFPFGNLARDNRKLWRGIKEVSETLLLGKIFQVQNYISHQKSETKKKPQIKTNPTIANISIIKHGHKKQQLVSVIESLLPMRQDGYCPKTLELHNVNANVFDISKMLSGTGRQLAVPL